MRRSPSIVPSGGGDTYLVLDELGRLGLSGARPPKTMPNLETIIRDLFDDQYSRPSASSPSVSPRGVSRRNLRREGADT